MFTRLLLVALLTITLCVFVGCQKKTAEEPVDTTAQVETPTEPPPAPEAAGALTAPDFNTLPVEQGAYAMIKTSMGDMKMEFLWDKAPNHCKNFIYLARAGYYNGTTFHRVIPGFMIQGGDGNSKDEDRANDGQGSPGYNINAEFNDVTHERGVVSMARTPDPNSAGAQFFICVGDAKYLDGQYSAFGRIVEGMEIADKIVASERDANDNPITKVTMNVEIITPPPAGQ
jgi:cyclophilin family peptidyl-prolyl cis-trans isomerase